jgi:hypothetical protein
MPRQTITVRVVCEEGAMDKFARCARQEAKEDRPLNGMLGLARDVVIHSMRVEDAPPEGPGDAP